MNSTASSRPLAISTTTHALTLSVYVGLIVLSTLHVSGVTNVDSLRVCFGEWIVPWWALAHLAAAVTAFVGAMYSPRLAVPLLTLKVEFVGVVGLSVIKLTYVFALATDHKVFPPDPAAYEQGVPSLLVFAGFLGLGAAARAVQIAYEVRRINKGLAAPRVMEPAPLADPE